MIKSIGKQGAESIWIPDLFETVVKEVSKKNTAYFDYGPIEDIVQNLSQKDGAITPALKQKYPLIWLVGDFAQEVGEFDFYCKLSADIIITTGTSSTFSLEERRDKKYEKILFPIYEELMIQLRRSTKFEAKLGRIPHTMINRPYWSGDEDKYLTNKFNEPIDAIQIKGLKIQVNNIY
jgi:hypothetical protein